jgi:hypothetical protein
VTSGATLRIEALEPLAPRSPLQEHEIRAGLLASVHLFRTRVVKIAEVEAAVDCSGSAT